MNALMIALRLVHVVFGVLWVGMMVFSVVFLTPAIREIGADGAKVLAALQRRGVMTVMPVLALGTLLSGMWLFSRFSGGAPMAMVRTPVGFTFAIGGAAALIAFVVGLAIIRPSTARAATLTKGLEAASTEGKRATAVEIQRLRMRATSAGQLVALLLLVAAAAMAVARYV
jgi:hypothetical protein